MNTQFTNTFQRDADAGQTGSMPPVVFDYTQDKKFWVRLRLFALDVQVSDLIGEEEKSMILHNCELKINAVPPIEREAMEVKADVLLCLKKLRAYFGEHDKTITEHTMYAIADKAIKTLSGAVEGNGWIDVKKRLPDFIKDKWYSENVIVINEGKRAIMCYSEIPGAGCNAWCNCYGDIDGHGQHDDDYNPTLWMPLPAAPKK